jgi:two-component system, NarL family, sensor histidine kinase UhpB
MTSEQHLPVQNARSTSTVTGWLTWFWVIGLLLVTQLLFWALLHMGERIAYPSSIDTRRDISFVAFGENGQPMPGVVRQKATVGDVAAAGYFAPTVADSKSVRFEIPFVLTDTLEPKGLFLSVRADIGQVRVNGVVVQSDTALARQQGDVSSEPAFFPLPAEALRLGNNLLTIDKPTFGAVHSLSSFAIGDEAELISAYRWRSLLLVDLPLIGVAILFFTAMLCLIANWPAEDRPRMRALTALLLVSAISTAVLSFAPQGQMPILVTIALYALANFAIAIAILHYAGLDSGLFAISRRWLIGLSVAIPAMVVAILWLGSGDAWIGTTITWTITIAFAAVIVAGVIASLMLAYATVRQGWRLWGERVALIICLAFFMVDRAGTLTPLYSPFDTSLPVTLPWSPVVGILLGAAVILSLARQASDSRRAVTDANIILANRLEEQDAELARQYEAQRELLATQAMHEERQRIVRDMHDGIGGQLLGLMMQVRGGGMQPAEVESGLQSSLADLRLIVDSMDTAEDGLGEALYAFEQRVRPQVEAAGLTFTMEHGLGEVDYRLGPRNVLHVLRILQEAITNAIRHSGASAIMVRSHGADGAIQIAVEDNGQGVSGDRKGGRGLPNMDNRARSLGGSLSVEEAAPGTRVLLSIPVAVAA